MIITINFPKIFLEIIEHYISRIESVVKDEKEPLKTKAVVEFLSEPKDRISELVKIFQNPKEPIGIDTDEMPHIREFGCLAINQYLKDLENDMKVISAKLSLNEDHLEKITRKLELVKSMKRDFQCDTIRS